MKQKLLLFLGFLLIFSFVFRSLLANLASGLIDWRDYALMVWIIFQHIDKIIHFNFVNYFDTTSFYPNQYSLLFSDLLLPQAILTLPFYLITKNLILSFNFVFILTFILNYISSFLFWKQIFKNDLLAFFGSLLLIFSPFFHLEYSHFQMMSYWPFLFSLYFLLKAEDSKKYIHSFIAGIFLSVQFLASVYLSVYLITCIVVAFLMRIFNRKELKYNLISGLIIILTLASICGIFIKGYVDMRQEYHVNRDIKEYITYSANLTDYIFTRPIDSLIHNSPLINKWDAVNKSSWNGQAAFPGFLIFILSLIGLFIYKRERKSLSVILNLDRQKALFLIITVVGLTFSLGPRLVFNGTYSHIPLPYTIALEYFPFFESTRVPARWSFLFYFGLIFFALIGLSKITSNKFKNYIFGICFVIFILEYIPLNIKASTENYFDDRDLLLQNVCSREKQLLLELPVTHMDAEDDIASGLSYITKAQLASTQHRCFIFNGYSGYDLPSIIELSGIMNQVIDSGDTQRFYNELRSRNIDMVKFNPDRFPTSRQESLQLFFNKLSRQEKIEEIQGTIYKINY